MKYETNLFESYDESHDILVKKKVHILKHL